MNSQIHSIVTDLDGTLLNRASTITDFTYKVLQSAIDTGIHLIFATGRRYHSVSEYVNRLQRRIGAVLNNGNIILIAPEMERISNHYLEIHLLEKIISSSFEKSFYPILHTNRYEEGIDLISALPIGHPLYLHYAGGKKERTIHSPKLDSQYYHNITVICLLSSNQETLLLFKSELENADFSHQIKCVFTTIPTVGPCLEIFKAGISKWSGVLEILQLYNLTSDGVLAFGDEANDIELMENAGISYSMKNGIPQLRTVSDHVTEFTNDEDGVARTIIQLGLV